MSFICACIQMNSQNDLQANLDASSEYIREAKVEGAEFVALPENVAFMADNYSELRDNSYPQSEHPAIVFYKDLCKELNIKLLVGSVAVKEEGKEKLMNRSLVIDNKGKTISTYDKIHLFDVSLPNGEKHNESERFESGTEAKIADIGYGKLGLSICYDLRFPALYRILAKGGADLLSVPSAFTMHTGKDHWHTLLKARAIENGCFVIAPAQCGKHPAGKETFGHSIIVNPWGDVITEANQEPGYIIAELDLEKVKEARGNVPSLQHDKSFNLAD